ncbi:sensor domain-containing diguanylate cyclase [Xanthomonas cannabis]|uniref:GGDEF domain-containing protein n=1 Tax=Xanthomonas cannabis TaxID=1885674 RepID=UPI001E2A2EE3|nr:sensor domain-containing diguanylate cyclase [Xanthomonas cannabis]MCC8441324.1 sensor domain-containing diguanylate cyclase [Xanthomonas cannabis]
MRPRVGWHTGCIALVSIQVATVTSTTKRWRQRAQRLALHFVLTISWLLLLGSEYWSIHEERASALRSAEAQSLNLANSLAQHASDTLSIADAVLSGLVSRVEHDQGKNGAHSAMHEFLVREARRSDRLHGIFIYAADGSWVSSSLDSTPRTHNNADRAYFRYHRDHRDALSLAGPPVRSRSDGSWVMTLSRRLNDSDGEFAGVVLVTLQLKYFQNYYSTFEVGPNGTIGMTNDDGIVLVRRPDKHDVIGTSIAGTSIYVTMRARKHGTATYRSPIDGVERISSFAPARPYPLTVLTGVSVDDALDNWRQAATQRIVIAALGCIVLLGVGIWLDLQLRRMHRNEAKLSSEAWVDALTGIANRRAFDYRLSQALREAVHLQSPLSVLMIDVDHFKLYNDTYGHVNGDACLRLIAGAIAACSRRSEDVAARYGGEEFGMILPHTDAAGALRLADAVRSAVAGLGLMHLSSPTSAHVTVSVGAATFEPGETPQTPDAIVHDADSALYRAKQSGRDRTSA